MLSRSLVEHQRSPLGPTARPTQLRIPVAKTRPFLPSGVNSSTSARSVSMPQAAPSECSALHFASSDPSRFPIPSATLLAEPTETNIFDPSFENTTSRVQWFEPLGSRATTVSAGPRALRSPLA